MESTNDQNTSDELSNLFLRSFEEYDDENIIVYENEPKPKITNPVSQMVNDVLLDRAKFSKSYAAACAHIGCMH